MRLLLDTHIYLWVVDDNSKLSAIARALIRDSDEVFISSAVIWEAAIKTRIGKLAADIPRLVSAIIESGFQELPIRASHAAAVTHLPDFHRDPFDRILIAQSLCEHLSLITADKTLAAYSSHVTIV